MKIVKGQARTYILLILLLILLPNLVLSFSQLVGTNCGKTVGCFRYPPGCEYGDCKHFLMWNDTGENTVDFSVTAKVNFSETGPNPWTAVGFSDDKNMV